VLAHVEPATIWQWKRRGYIEPVLLNRWTPRGIRKVHYYRELDVLTCERDRRLAPRGGCKRQL
jgi:hypothetical protein